MNECERMRDAMVDVAAARTSWNDHDAAHVALCDDCRESWTVVSAAAQLGRASSIDGARVAAGLRARLVHAPLSAPRKRWTELAIGVAAAALIGLGLTSSHRATSGSGDRIEVPTEQATAMFPELEALSEPQLKVILAGVADADADLDGGAAIPRLGDLNDEQLEELILSVEGE